jgi:hypothetical protein
MGGRLIPWEGFCDLLRDPFRRRMVGEIRRRRSWRRMTNTRQPKVNRRHHKEIHAADIGHMVAQKRLPRLAGPPGRRLAMYLAIVD